MSNSYFQFKQFIVFQNKCAMKVCTDTCTFGAFISMEEKDKSDNKTNILDIGAGTGLLSLMAVQKIKGSIDAVEIEKNAFEQAFDNFKNSIWKSRLLVYHADITKIELSKKYDIIISNPPFFNNSLKSNNDLKSLEKHNTSLSYTELVSVVYANLTEKGRFYILLPFEEFKAFEKIANDHQLVLLKRTDIRSNEASEYFRTIGVFTFIAVQETTLQSLTIKDDNNEYTSDFVFLMKDYYLYL